MMKILLIDVDSTIPNLALMKVSAYYKSLGDEVGFNVIDPDMIYASVIFKKNKHLVDGLPFFYPNAKLNIGGSGYSLSNELPECIEWKSPDYDIYPECDRFYGFTTRGCIRNCSFCIVRKKEGEFRRLFDTPKQAIQFITGGDTSRYSNIEFLDNNILADKEWFKQLCIECRSYGYKVDFNQGLDIRLIDDECAKILSTLKPITCWKFAFDSMSYKESVLKGIDILNRNGINVRTQVFFYVYVDSDKEYEDALERCHILKKNGATPYIMLNQDVDHSRRMKDLKRWCRPWIFWSCDIDEYARGIA